MKRVLVLVVFVCFPLLFAQAQTTAQVSGTVSDASGAAVPSAQVQITNTDTNAVRTVQTGGDGSYTFGAVPDRALQNYGLKGRIHQVRPGGDRAAGEYQSHDQR